MKAKTSNLFKSDNKPYVFISSQGVSFDYRILHAGLQTDDNNLKDKIDRYVFNYVIGGEMTYIIDNKSYILHKGDIFINFPLKTFKMINNKNNPNKYFYVAFNSNNIDNLLFHAGLSVSNPVLHANSPHIEKQVRKIPVLLMKNTFSSIARAKLTLDEIFCELLDMRNENHKQVTSKTVFILNQAIEYMTSNYNLPITIKEIAQEIFTNRSYLSKIFTATYHTTIKEYLTNLRLTKAAELLIHSDMAINKISDAVGFNSYVNFYKAFLKHYLTSPKNYRIQNEVTKKQLSEQKT